VAAAARRHLDEGGMRRRPADLVDRMTDHFLRVVPPQRVTWVHPSWRDLVIDQLAGDPPARGRFLERCSLEGLLLAVSVGGGATGERRFPLLVADADWDAATDRLGKLIGELEDTELVRLLESLTAAVHAPADARVRAEAQALAQRCLTVTREHVDGRRAPVPVALLESWYVLADGVAGAVRGPQLAATWIELLPTAAVSTATVADLVRIEEWLRLARVLAEHDPGALAGFGFPDRSRDLLERLAHEASRFSGGERGEVLARIARLLARIGACRPLLLVSAPLPSVESWFAPEGEPEPPSEARPVEDDWRFVARVLADLEPSA
jgi:hypothetical protein